MEIVVGKLPLTFTAMFRLGFKNYKLIKLQQNDKESRKTRITDCHSLNIAGVSGSVDLTGINSTNSTAIIGNTTTDTTMMKAGWYSDNFSTYYLDDNGVKHYR